MTTAVTFDDGRQNSVIATFPFTFDQLISATHIPLIKLPTNAVVLAANATIDTALNSATSDTVSISDQPTGASARPTEYSTAQNAHVIGNVPGVFNGYKYLAGGNLGVVWTGVGAVPTAGAGRLMVEYYIEGRATEVQDR